MTTIMRTVRLTPRERKYLIAQALGLTAETTANKYGTTPRAVSSSLRLARAKLDGRNGTHTVVIALQRGIITLDEIRKGLPE